MCAISYFTTLHCYTFQAACLQTMCTARNATILIFNVILPVSIVGRGKIILNHLKEGLLVTTAEVLTALATSEAPTELEAIHEL